MSTTAILVIALVICAFGWFYNRVALKAMLIYILGKGYDAPSDWEIAECVREALRRTLHLK